MTFVFVSNFFNHHQKKMAEALRAVTDFTFIATEEMPEEKRQLGYADEKPPYVRYSYESKTAMADCMRLIDEADVVVFGSAPEGMLAGRIKRGQLTLRYSERPLKNGRENWKYLIRLIRWRKRNPMNKQLYLLCASAYTAGDYARFGLFENKAYRWGYFPEALSYDEDVLMAGKNPTALLWCGRFLDWKHPDAAVRVVKRLSDEGYALTLDFVGMGDMEDTLRRMIQELHLEDRVRLLGSMPPEEVRRRMEGAGIYLFTSDFAEGWGAVANEAMNSGCAVVASHAAGATPFLIRNGQNGLIYESENEEMLYETVKDLLDHPDKQQRLGRAAYRSIRDDWNAEAAAQRLLLLIEAIRSGNAAPELFDVGPCSRAQVLSEAYKGD